MLRVRTFLSRVCSTVMFFAPLRNCFVPDHHWTYFASSPAVGINTIPRRDRR